VKFGVNADGSPPFSFQWRKDGRPIAGATGELLTIQAMSARDVGNYDCIVKNSAGEKTSQSIKLVVRPP
jgi:hypothetical protein